MAYGKDTVELARRMFVEDGLTIENIAEKLNPPVSFWTVKNWKDRGQWDYEKENIENSDNFAKNAFQLASSLMSKIEKQDKEGKEASKTQIEMLKILTTKVTNIMQIDLERKKLSKKENSTSDLPEEVAKLPRVQEAMLTINKAISEYNRGINNEV